MHPSLGWCLGILALCTGCSSQVVESEITACDGQLSAEPTLLASFGGLNVQLELDDDTLVLADSNTMLNGRLMRLDRCSGSELASVTVPFLGAIALEPSPQGHRTVVLRGVNEGPSTWLYRWNESAEDLDFLAESLSGGTLYVTGAGRRRRARRRRHLHARGDGRAHQIPGRE